MAKRAQLNETRYFQHPISAELKKLLNANGVRIVDAQFAPEGAKVFTHEDVNEAELWLATPQSQPTLSQISTELKTSVSHIFGDKDMAELRERVSAGVLFKVKPVTEEGELYYVLAPDEGDRIEGLFNSEQQAHEVLEDTMAEYGSEELLATLYGTAGSAPATAAEPATGAASTESTETPAGTEALPNPVPEGWETLAWNEKIALAKQLSGQDKVEAADGKTATQVAEDIIRSFLPKA